MKKLVHFLCFLSVIAFSSKVLGQISNLTVNGSSTHFTMASGDEISWSYDLPTGGTAVLEIWLDINGSTSIESGTDKLWESFFQVDGQAGFDGPPDLDGEANGHIMFAQEIGLAPGNYIMSFSNGGSTINVSGTITPLTSPVFTISGHVNVPAGKSARYLLVGLENDSDGEGSTFWNALTDANGDFSILMDGDTTGNPWRLNVYIDNSLNPSVLEPMWITLHLDSSVSTTYSGNNFAFVEAAAEVNGTLKDEDENPLSGRDVYIYGAGGSIQRYARTDNSGIFRFGMTAGELPASNVMIGSGNPDDTSFVFAFREIPLVNGGNTLTENLVMYKTNSTISGSVLLNGNPPNMNLAMNGVINDTGLVKAYTNLNGEYILHVSDKLYNYSINTEYLPPNYINYSITAHPGEINVNFNFTMTEVEESQSSIPNNFSLEQNYPNPFNPITLISYNLKEACNVQVKIFNIHGSEIEILVNEYKSAGNYKLRWNAVDLPSGVYFYRLQAGSFTDTKKMVLLK